MSDGIACHTTEYNLSSHQHTFEGHGTVSYRRQDIEQLIHTLRRRGHTVRKLAIAPDAPPLDSYVDTPPYRSDLHLQLKFAGYIMTS